jgi:hypothetical protein
MALSTTVLVSGAARVTIGKAEDAQTLTRQPLVLSRDPWSDLPRISVRCERWVSVRCCKLSCGLALRKA